MCIYIYIYTHTYTIYIYREREILHSGLAEAKLSHLVALPERLRGLASGALPYMCVYIYIYIYIYYICVYIYIHMYV